MVPALERAICNIELMAEAGSPKNLRWQRLAELVANRLRDRILSGDLEDGALLPKEEELREAYPVSKPSIREAMRILEAEGLITVRRGNVGGAVVHRPSSTNVAYTLAMVLRAEDVGFHDVAMALREVEPACAALCAERKDRRRAVVPKLRAIHKESLKMVDDLVVATEISRRFHEAIVSLCGNGSLIVIVGALETLWSTHETGWSRTKGADQLPVNERREALQAHAELIEAIAEGDATRARELTASHLQAVQNYPSMTDDNSVAPERLKDRLALG